MDVSSKIERILTRKWDKRFLVKRFKNDLIFFVIDPKTSIYETIPLKEHEVNQEIVKKMMIHYCFNEVSIKWQSESLWFEIIVQDPRCIKYVPSQFVSYEMAELAIKHDPSLIENISNEEWVIKLIHMMNLDSDFKWGSLSPHQHLLDEEQFCKFLYYTAYYGYKIKHNLITNKILEKLFDFNDKQITKKSLKNVCLPIFKKDIWNEDLYIKACVNEPTLYKKLPIHLKNDMNFNEKLIDKDNYHVVIGFMKINRFPIDLINKIISNCVWDVEFLENKEFIVKFLHEDPRIILNVKKELLTNDVYEQSLNIFNENKLDIKEDELSITYINKVLDSYEMINGVQLMNLYFWVQNIDLKNEIKNHEKFPTETSIAINVLEKN